MRYVVRLLAVVLLSGVGLALGLPVAGPADAAVCSDDIGVTVVVDFHQLGGGVQSVCDPDGGGRTAAALFVANGFPLDYVQRQPGFVCRVSGKPVDDPCVNTPPADAYWGLFWSKGDSGTWSYATLAAGSLKIPAGGSVAFSWQGSSSRTDPGVAPPRHSTQQPSQPSTSPSSKPSQNGGGTGGTGGGSTPAANGPTTSGSTSPTTSAGPRGDQQKPRDHTGTSDNQRKGRAARRHDNATPTPEDGSTLMAEPAAPTGAPAAAVGGPTGDSGGLPGWVPMSVIGLLFLTAVGVGVAQRRRS